MECGGDGYNISNKLNLQFLVADWPLSSKQNAEKMMHLKVLKQMVFGL